VIEEGSCKTFCAMLSSYVILLFVWVYALYSQLEMMAVVVYVGVTFVSCGFYAIAEFVYIILKGNKKGMVWLILGSIEGVAGLAAMLFWTDKLCLIFTPFLNGAFWWFVASDFAMLYIYKFFMENKVGLVQEEKGSIPIPTTDKQILII